jgi:hypothetical protein
MALFNWMQPDERKTSTVIADAVGDHFGPRTILHALEEAVPRYVSDVDQGTLIYPARILVRNFSRGSVVEAAEGKSWREIDGVGRDLMTQL